MTGSSGVAAGNTAVSTPSEAVAPSVLVAETVICRSPVTCPGSTAEASTVTTPSESTLMTTPSAVVTEEDSADPATETSTDSGRIWAPGMPASSLASTSMVLTWPGAISIVSGFRVGASAEKYRVAVCGCVFCGSRSCWK